MARKPIRRIHDDYPQFSAVAVDLEHNEVIMADENLFQMLVYDRTANTPPAGLTVMLPVTDYATAVTSGQTLPFGSANYDLPGIDLILAESTRP